MSGYVIAGYGLTLFTLGAYAAWVTRRARALRRPVSKDPTASDGAS